MRLELQDNFRSDLCGFFTDTGTSRCAVSTPFMESLSLFRNVEAVASSIENLVDFWTESMPHLFLESEIGLFSRHHGFVVLFYLFFLFPACDQSNRHDGPRQRAAGLPSAGYTASQGAGSLENLDISYG